MAGSWLKAVWITPSAAAVALRRLSGSLRSPRCTSTPAVVSEAAAASERARPTTWCPASSSSWTVALPMNPVAPVTNTRMMHPFSLVGRNFLGRRTAPNLSGLGSALGVRGAKRSEWFRDHPMVDHKTVEYPDHIHTHDLEPASGRRIAGEVASVGAA